MSTYRQCLKHKAILSPFIYHEFYSYFSWFYFYLTVNCWISRAFMPFWSIKEQKSKVFIEKILQIFKTDRWITEWNFFFHFVAVQFVQKTFTFSFKREKEKLKNNWNWSMEVIITNKVFVVQIFHRKNREIIKKMRWKEMTTWNVPQLKNQKWVAKKERKDKRKRETGNYRNRAVTRRDIVNLNSRQSHSVFMKHESRWKESWTCLTALFLFSPLFLFARSSEIRNCWCIH